MNIVTMRIAEPIPPGDTLLRAMIRATSAAGFVKVPSGGNVDAVFILADHFRFPVFKRIVG